MFVLGLGGYADRDGSRCVQSDGNGFKEDDQVAAWTAAQDGATKSKQGLGRSGQPRKVGGARWQGTRTKLDSDDEATCVHFVCISNQHVRQKRRLCVGAAQLHLFSMGVCSE